MEAQITGQLEHPSIVPLHDLGMDANGRPFYVMKFIQGRRLTEVILDYHSIKTTADWPSDLAFRRLLEAFVSICNVIAYAHSKGVLHRDIKPDNVMLGPYGEVVVLDWGLAKVIGQAEQPGDKMVQVSSGSVAATRDGAVVGTPSYLSPEGAGGRLEEIDQSSDVYLLGGTLYAILTSRPPRQWSSSQELIDLALHGRPTRPRRLEPRIPRALEAICMKSIAFQKQERYATPTALAEDVQRFLAGGSTLAYPEPLWMRMGRWMRRHRRGIVRGMTVLAVLLLAAVAIRNDRAARLLAERERARGQLSEFHRLANEAQFFAANSDPISEQVPYYHPDRAKMVGQKALKIAAPWGDKAERLALPEQRADLLRTHYAILLMMARTDLEGDARSANPRQALARLDRAKEILPLSRGYHRLRSRCLTLLGEQQSARREEELAEHTRAMAEDYFLQGELLRLKDLGASARMIVDENPPHTRDHLVQAVEEYQKALQSDPRHYWARFQLGRCRLALGRGPEAVEALSACIALRPQVPWAYSARGLASALSNRPTEVLDDLNRAIELDPSFQPARLHRAMAHWLRGDHAAAVADFSAVLAAPADQQLVEAAFYRGQILFGQQKDAQALADFSKVLYQRPGFRPAYWFRAKTHFRLGSYESGLADLKTSVSLGQQQTTSNHPSLQHLVLGKTLRKMAQELEGETRKQLLLAAASQLQSAIAAGTPTAEMLQHLGAVGELLGATREAIASYTRGLELAADDVLLRNMRGWAYANEQQYDSASADFVEVLRLAPNNPDAHAGLGFALARLGRDVEARREASAALLSGADNHIVLHNVACIYGRLSETEPERRLEHENLALAALNRAVSISSRNSIGPDADEVTLIRTEKSFPASLQSRPEFQELLKRQAPSH